MKSNLLIIVFISFPTFSSSFQVVFVIASRNYRKKMENEMDSKINMVWCRDERVEVVSQIERSMKYRPSLSAEFNALRVRRLSSAYEDSEKKSKLVTRSGFTAYVGR